MSFVRYKNQIAYIYLMLTGFSIVIWLYAQDCPEHLPHFQGDNSFHIIYYIMLLQTLLCLLFDD